MGPTASGKTALAYELVQHFPMEIVSIDSTMIYRELNIGSAKPNQEFLSLAPHHLIDIIDPIDVYSVAACCKDVETICQSIFARQHIPLLVGGTMMYFNALQKGLAPLPEADSAIRDGIVQEAQQFGWQYLHHELAKVDSISAMKIHPNDQQRIQRALEVYRLTQVPLSEHFRGNQKSNLQFLNIALLPETRSLLHQRIAKRFEQMLKEGLIDEVETLLKKWPLTEVYPSMRSVGYRQVFQYLKGEYNLVELPDKAIAATRQLAKRQYTWLRHLTENIEYITEDVISLKKIIAKVAQMLDNPKFSS